MNTNKKDQPEAVPPCRHPYCIMFRSRICFRSACRYRGRCLFRYFPDQLCRCGCLWLLHYFSRRLQEGTDGLNCFLLCLVLSLISAYALNHIIPVFESAVPWLSCMLVLVGAAYSGLGYMDRCPAWLRCLTGFIIGAGFLLFLLPEHFSTPPISYSFSGKQSSWASPCMPWSPCFLLSSPSNG